MRAVQVCVFEVRGIPGPQGSKRHVGNGVMVESSKKVKPWREAVKWAARENGTRVDGAVSVCIAYTLPKPKSAPKRRKTWPDRKPDIDKLTRSTFDALKDAGVFEDDARVIRLVTEKLYPNEGTLALDVPGAVIEVRSAEAIEQ